MHTSSLLASALLLSVVIAYTPPAYWRNVPPPLEDYRTEYQRFKDAQRSNTGFRGPVRGGLQGAALVEPQASIHKNEHLQQEMSENPGIAFPPPPSSPAPEGDTNSDLTISDILPRQRSINVFAGLTRNVESLSSRLESTLPASNTTLLAPLNSVMQSLPRKPWEDRPSDNVDAASSARNNEDTAANNLRRFVLEHAIPASPWREGEKVKSLGAEENGGVEIWWETRKGGADGSESRRVIMPGEVVVDSVVGKVGNGEIWAIKGVVNYE